MVKIIKTLDHGYPVGADRQCEAKAPFSLLEPPRMLRDEGPLGALRIVGNVVRNGAARRRVFALRSVMRQYRHVLAAVAITCLKPEWAGSYNV